jgi:Acyl-CoA reductase (LuxC)
MNLQHRIDLLVRLGQYILSDDEAWLETKDRASRENGWFTPAFINLSGENIARSFLQKDILEAWAVSYKLPAQNKMPRQVGIIMAGNIPLVGFHDWLCVFISGHKAIIKASSKDQVLIKHLVGKITEWSESTSSEDAGNQTVFAEMLKGCDAYIATGSNNSSRYFEYYFGKYPNIIRRNRTSAAILLGDESASDLEKLADDVFLYFGLGCRNVTKMYVPQDYNFIPLIEAFKKYNYLADHHKYKNNYDYNLALHLLNKKYYMTNGSILIVEEPALFSPISQLNYEYYNNAERLGGYLKNNEDLQCLIGKNFIPFGQSQTPSITDYADGADTLKFLSQL